MDTAGKSISKKTGTTLVMRRKEPLPDARAPEAAATTTSGKKKRYRRKRLKKAPGAPLRFKTAFIFFSIAKHKEYRNALGKRGAKEKTTNVAKMVSKAWKNLSKDERIVWDAIAAKDKARYEMEKSAYDGPWQVIDKEQHPLAPRRPCSAFINFLNSKREQVKREHPLATSVEVMRIAAKLWYDNDPDREICETRATKERETYRKEMKAWKVMQRREASKGSTSRRNDETSTDFQRGNDDFTPDQQDVEEEDAVVNEEEDVVSDKALDRRAVDRLSAATVLANEKMFPDPQLSGIPAPSSLPLRGMPCFARNVEPSLPRRNPATLVAEGLLNVSSSGAAVLDYYQRSLMMQQFAQHPFVAVATGPQRLMNSFVASSSSSPPTSIGMDELSLLLLKRQQRLEREELAFSVLERQQLNRSWAARLS